MSDDLLTRHGRPTELSLARLEAGELSREQEARVRAALEDDPEARAVLEEMAAIDLRPSPAVAAAARARETDSPGTATGHVVQFRRWISAGAASLAAAAGLALWISSDPGPTGEPITDAPGDGIRTKGVEFAFELWIDDGVSTRRARDGDPVRAGDKLAFKAYPRRDGHLVVLCVDPSGTAAVCHALGSDAAVPMTVHARGGALEVAPGLAFDDAPGTERFVALLCDAPPDLDALVADPDSTPAGCLREETSVRKAEGG